MAAMFYEMASIVYKTGVSLKEHWENLCAKYGYFEMITSYYFCNDTKIIDSIFDQLRDYKGTGTYPAACGEFKIKSVRDVTLGFDNAMPGNKSVFPHTPNQNMLTFTFENGSVLTLRPSGTEPKLKYYVESNSKQSREEAKAITQAVTEALVNDFIQPKKYGMKGKGE
jgi:phosphomannomutase